MVARDVLGYFEANDNVEAHTGPKRLCELALLDSARRHVLDVVHALVACDIAQANSA